MSTANEVLRNVSEHMEEGTHKHARWPNLDVGLGMIMDRMTKLQSAIGSTSDPDHLQQVSRRAAQLSGLAARLIVDAGLPLVEPMHVNPKELYPGEAPTPPPDPPDTEGSTT